MLMLLLLLLLVLVASGESLADIFTWQESEELATGRPEDQAREHKEEAGLSWRARVVVEKLITHELSRKLNIHDLSSPWPWDAN